MIGQTDNFGFGFSTLNGNRSKQRCATIAFLYISDSLEHGSPASSTVSITGRYCAN